MSGSKKRCFDRKNTVLKYTIQEINKPFIFDLSAETDPINRQKNEQQVKINNNQVKKKGKMI